MQELENAPTRDKAALDQVFVGNYMMVHNLNIVKPGFSDNETVYVELIHTKVREKRKFFRL